jgi:multidrug resistance efflux pump
MAELTELLPARRPELLIKPFGDKGQYVVKDPRSGEFFHLGEKEYFLLTRLDGVRTADEISLGFAEQFGESLTEDELDEFIELVRGQGLLQAETRIAPVPGELPVALPISVQRESSLERDVKKPVSPRRQSILHWRRSLWDPDRFFSWMVPRIGFFWTPAFLLLSASCIMLAGLLVWANRQELARSFSEALRWETAALVWLALLLIGTLHECVHGLTCKHYGGEVHEIGFLLLYLMPCFYCNVSDAWLFREKSKRLWVTFAGGYFELFLWALAVFLWRLTPPGTLVNHLAFVVLSVCGIQTLFNFNPLLKLDGYYLISDWLEIPNFQQRALDCFKGRLRWLLWGAARPGREPRSRLLLGFGLATWLYSLLFLAPVLAAILWFLAPHWGLLGLGAVALVGFLASRRIFEEFSAGEVSKMVRLRRKRAGVWVLALGGLVAGLFLMPIEDWAGGAFQVRALTRAELRAPAAGFLREVYGDEGDRISPGAPVARLEVSDLVSRLAQKQAELREAQAKLHLLEAGPRYEVLLEQRRCVERARAWHDLARQDLTRLRQVLKKELARLEKQIALCQAEVSAAQEAAHRGRSLLGKAAISAQEYQELERRLHVGQAQLEQAQAEKEAHEAKGTLEAETELARRERQLADAQSTLSLLESGPRSEEVEAEGARVARLREQARYLEQLQDRLQVLSPVPGLLTTPRLNEKVGQYLREGEFICVVEEPAELEVEITLAEQDAARVRPGQAVALRARASPFETINGSVARVASTANLGEVQSTVTVYARFHETSSELKPGMTGYARISTGSRPIGTILADRVLRWLRTEFWWW